MAGTTRFFASDDFEPIAVEHGLDSYDFEFALDKIRIHPAIGGRDAVVEHEIAGDGLGRLRARGCHLFDALVGGSESGGADLVVAIDLHVLPDSEIAGGGFLLLL